MEAFHQRAVAQYHGQSLPSTIAQKVGWDLVRPSIARSPASRLQTDRPQWFFHCMLCVWSTHCCSAWLPHSTNGYSLWNNWSPKTNQQSKGRTPNKNQQFLWKQFRRHADGKAALAWILLVVFAPCPEISISQVQIRLQLVFGIAIKALQDQIQPGQPTSAAETYPRIGTKNRLVNHHPLSKKAKIC